MGLSEQAAQKLAEGSTAIGWVAEFKARVADLEAQGHRLEVERVKAEEALRKEKHGKEPDQCLPGPFFHCFASNLHFV